MGADRSAYLARLAAAGYAPALLPDGTPCAIVDRGGTDARVFVLSIPKAGTYLASAVIAALGVRPANLHVDDGWASDFRAYVPGTRMWTYQFEMPVHDALALLLPGQFALGHLPREPRIEQALEGFRKVFVFRELRHAIVSWARFVIAEEMDGGVADAVRTLADGPERVRWVVERPSSAWLVPTCRAMVGWRDAPGVLPVAFEDMAGARGEAAQHAVADALVDHLGLDCNPDAARRAARACVGAGTLTWSGARSTLATHWDEGLEAWFRSVGGPSLNAQLGYPGDLDPAPR